MWPVSAIQRKGIYPMRKFIGLAAVILLVAIIVPAAFAGSDPPTIRQYQNEKGNKITSIKIGKVFFIAGDKLNTVLEFQCFAGKFEGKKQWSSMDFEVISSKLVEALPSPDCAGNTGPVRAFYTETSSIVGPDLTVTGTPV